VSEQPASVGDRRRLIQRAIRSGDATPPAGLEELALHVAIRQASLWWITILYAFGVVVEIMSVVLADTNGQRIAYAVLGLGFLALGLQQRRQVRRAREAVDRWAPTAE
jgi:hypothetical protein